MFTSWFEAIETVKMKMKSSGAISEVALSEAARGEAVQLNSPLSPWIFDSLC